MCIAPRTDDIVNIIFKELIHNRRYEDLAKMVMLSARNIDGEEINCRVVELFD